MVCLWDDRCIQVEKNAGRPVRRPFSSPELETLRDSVMHCIESGDEEGDGSPVYRAKLVALVGRLTREIQLAKDEESEDGWWTK